jgi:hypothetical protein
VQLHRRREGGCVLRGDRRRGDELRFLEPFNEPNLLAVQDSGPGGLNAGETVAFMMYRAKQIIGTPAYNKTPLIGGPCVHDQDLTTP